MLDGREREEGSSGGGMTRGNGYVALKIGLLCRARRWQAMDGSVAAVAGGLGVCVVVDDLGVERAGGRWTEFVRVSKAEASK